MNTDLIDMFGLSGDPESDDRLEEFLARVEADIENPHSLGTAEYWQLQQSITAKSNREQARIFYPRLLAQRQPLFNVMLNTSSSYKQ